MLSRSRRLKLNVNDFRWLAEIGHELLLDLCNGCFARVLFNHHFRPVTHARDILVLCFSENHIIRHTIPLDVSLHRSQSRLYSKTGRRLAKLPLQNIGADWNIILGRDGAGTVEREFGQGEVLHQTGGCLLSHRHLPGNVCACTRPWDIDAVAHDYCRSGGYLRVRWYFL